MALIKCPECGREISDQVRKCPNCGYPIKKGVPKAVIGAVAAACVIAAAGGFYAYYQKVVVPRKNYEAAVSLYEQKELDAAEEKFQALNGYKDSKDYLEKIADERTYETAKNAFESGDYDTAETLFSQISSFSDSGEFLDRIGNERIYREACELYEANEYTASRELFETIPGYNDADEIVAQMDADIEYNDCIDRLAEYGSYAESVELLGEGLLDEVTDIWYNSIYEVSSYSTDKYTKDENGWFHDDFNTSLAAYFNSEEYSGTREKIIAGKETVDALYSSIGTLPDSLSDCGTKALEVHNAYTDLVNLSLDIKGNLNSLSEDVQTKKSGFFSAYKDFKLSLPEKIDIDPSEETEYDFRHMNFGMTMDDVRESEKENYGLTEEYEFPNYISYGNVNIGGDLTAEIVYSANDYRVVESAWIIFPAGTAEAQVLKLVNKWYGSQFNQDGIVSTSNEQYPYLRVWTHVEDDATTLYINPMTQEQYDAKYSAEGAETEEEIEKKTDIAEVILPPETESFYAGTEAEEENIEELTEAETETEGGEEIFYTGTEAEEENIEELTEPSPAYTPAQIETEEMILPVGTEAEEALSNATEAETVLPVGTEAEEVIEEIMTEAEEVIEAAGTEAEPEGIAEVLTEAEEAIEEIMTEAEEVIEAAGTEPESEDVAEVLTEAEEAIEEIMTEAEEAIGEIVTEAEETVGEIMTEAEETFGEVMTEEEEAVDEIMTEAEETFGEVMTEEEAVDEVMTEEEEAVDEFMTEAEENTETVRTAGETVLAIATEAEDEIDTAETESAVEEIAGVLTEAEEAIDELVTEAEEAASEIMEEAKETFLSIAPDEEESSEGTVAILPNLLATESETEAGGFTGILPNMLATESETESERPSAPLTNLFIADTETEAAQTEPIPDEVAEVLTEAGEFLEEVLTEAEDTLEEIQTEAEEALAEFMTEAEEAAADQIAEAESELGIDETEIENAIAPVVGLFGEETEAAAEETEAAPAETEAEEAPAETDAEEAPAETKAEVVEAADDSDVMSYEEYAAAEVDDPVVIEAYVQAKQAWYEGNQEVGTDTATIYAQDEDGGYFLYNVPVSKEVYDQLEEGTRIRVSGYKSEWAGEVEIVVDDELTPVEIIDGEFVAEPTDVTDVLADEEALKEFQNQKVAFTGLTVEAAGSSDETEAEDGAVETPAFLYGWDGSGSEGDDLYFMASKDGQVYTFVIESYLCGPDTEVYQAVKELKAGDVIDMEGFLYWYEGAQPHITSVTVR